jgi:hypothetical protein
VQRVGWVVAVEDHLVAGELAALRDREETTELRLGQIAEEVASKHRELQCDGRDTRCVKHVQHTQAVVPSPRPMVMKGTGHPSGGGREMIRNIRMIKVWLTMAIAMGSLALTAQASAMRNALDDGGATATPQTPTLAAPDGFAWADAMIGAAVTLALVLAAIAVVHTARHRNRLAPSH